jgi:hypothetical protein
LQKKKVPKKSCPKSQLNGFVTLQSFARMGPKAIKFAPFWGLPRAPKENIFVFVVRQNSLTNSFTKSKSVIHGNLDAAVSPPWRSEGKI